MVKRRQAWIAAISASAAIAVGGMALATSATAQPEPLAREVGTGAYYTMSERTYLATIKALLAGIPHANQTNAEYIQGGRDICGQINGGATWQNFLTDADLYNLDIGFYRAAIPAAISTFCPEHEGFVD